MMKLNKLTAGVSPMQLQKTILLTAHSFNTRKQRAVKAKKVTMTKRMIRMKKKDSKRIKSSKRKFMRFLLNRHKTNKKKKLKISLLIQSMQSKVIVKGMMLSSSRKMHQANLQRLLQQQIGASPQMTHQKFKIVKKVPLQIKVAANKRLNIKEKNPRSQTIKSKT